MTISKRLWRYGLALFLITSFKTAISGEWNIGSGIYDITGPAASTNLVGYDLSIPAQGIQTRLWSRAFIIQQPTSRNEIVFVSTDLLNIPQGVKQGVIKKLANKYGKRFSDANVMLTATHTHIGPGGYDHHIMMNLSAKGHNKMNSK